MKKANITVTFDEEKLGALEFSLKKAGSSVQARLEQTLGQLYEQTVPARCGSTWTAAPPPAPRPRRPARVWHCVASPQKIQKDEFDMSTQTRFIPTEVCTLISHETVSMLDTVQTEIPQCVRECRTALEALTTAHNLGEHGETLLNWLDTEIANAELFATDGVNLPYLIDMTCLNPEPDAAVQMDLIWALFETAAREECGPEQRQALLAAARTVTEMCGMEDLLLAAPRPNAAKLAKGLSAELDDIRCALKVNAELYPSSVRQELG